MGFVKGDSSWLSTIADEGARRTGASLMQDVFEFSKDALKITPGKLSRKTWHDLSSHVRQGIGVFLFIN